MDKNDKINLDEINFETRNMINSKENENICDKKFYKNEIQDNKSEMYTMTYRDQFNLFKKFIKTKDLLPKL